VAQGTFQNLDFESPNAAGLTNGFVAFSDAFPGWTGWTAGTNQASLAGYNFVSGGLALATLIIPGSQGAELGVIGGNYSATMLAGQFPPLVGVVSMAIAQTGDVSPSARSLRFSARGDVQYLAVSFNGASVPFSQVGTGPNYSVYAGDISSFAGTSGELRFTEQAVPTGSVLYFDDIFFSTTPVPEPGALALIGAGALLAACRWSARKQ
jgi:hypothetical protein